MPLISLLRRLCQHRPRRWEWVVLTLAGVVLLLLLLLPGLLRREIAARLAVVTTAEVGLGDVDFNPFRGRLVLKRLALTLKGEERPVIAVQEFVLNLRLFSLLRGRVSLEEARLSGLRTAAVQQTDGQLNLNRLFPPSPPSETPPAVADLPTLTIERVVLSAGQIDYEDLTYNPPARFTLAVNELTTTAIGLQARGIGAPVAVRLEGQLEGSPLRGEAQVSWQRTHTAVEAQIETPQLALAAIEPYLHNTLALQRLSGHVGARLRYRYQSGGDPPPVHALEGSLTLEHVLFADPASGQTALDLPSGRVAVETIDLHGREVRLATLELQNPKLFFLQTQTGLNWAALVRTPDPARQSETPPSAVAPWRFVLREARLAGGEIIYRDSAWADSERVALVPEEIQVQHLGSEANDSPLRFRLRLGEGTLAGEGNLRFSPLTVQAQIQLAEVDLTTLHPLLTRTLAAERVAGTVNGTVGAELETRDGTQVVSMSGAVDTKDLSLAGVPQGGSALAWESGHVELRAGSTLLPLDLGVTAQLSRFSLQSLPQGDISIEKANGDLRLTQAQPGSPAAAGGSGEGELRSEGQQRDSSPRQSSLPLHAEGVIEITSSTLTHAPEKQILLGCYQARAKLSPGSSLLPLDLRFQDLTLEYIYSQGLRTAAGQFQLFIPSADAPSPAAVGEQTPIAAPAPTPVASSASSPAVHIDQVTVRGGELYFEDHAMTPPQTLYWQDVRLDLSKVGYPFSPPTVFAAHAYNQDGAPIEFQGTTERQGGQTLTRVHGQIDRMSLVRLNSYLEPHLGYRVRNGAFSLTWDLVIPGDRLQANAKLALHNFGLGSKQNASILEQQVGLPLSLVVALLKDLNGNINLQLPVEGRMSEPGFRLGGTILRAIRDVLIGAVMSPLKVLGAVFSKKDTLQDFSLEPIRFAPGTSRLSGPGKEQSAHLSRFLSQRPELDLRLSGHTGPDDLRVLTDQLALVQLPEQMPPPGGQPAPGSEQEDKTPPRTPQDEVRQFLTAQLTQAGGGALPTLSAEATALLAQLRGQVVVAQSALERLAAERVQAVIADLTVNPAIAPSRLHLAQEKSRGREGVEVRYLIQAGEGGEEESQ